MVGKHDNVEHLDVSHNPCLSEIATLLHTTSVDFPNLRNLKMSLGKVENINQFLEAKEVNFENLVRLDLSNSF